MKPYRACSKITPSVSVPLTTTERRPVDPCFNDPCGPNARCRAINEVDACVCLEGYIGSPPSCRPECTINAECANTLACIDTKCRDPCPGTVDIWPKTIRGLSVLNSNYETFDKLQYQIVNDGVTETPFFLIMADQY